MGYTLSHVVSVGTSRGESHVGPYISTCQVYVRADDYFVHMEYHIRDDPLIEAWPRQCMNNLYCLLKLNIYPYLTDKK